MTEVYLIDKSALARVARQPTVRAALERLDDNGVLATSAVIDLEIGYSARNLAEFESVAADRAGKSFLEQGRDFRRRLVGLSLDKFDGNAGCEVRRNDGHGAAARFVAGAP